MKWNDPKHFLPSFLLFYFSYHCKENHFEMTIRMYSYYSYNFIKFTILTLIHYLITVLHISIFSVYIWNNICMYVNVLYCIFFSSWYLYSKFERLASFIQSPAFEYQMKLNLSSVMIKNLKINIENIFILCVCFFESFRRLYFRVLENISYSFSAFTCILIFQKMLLALELAE